VERTPTTMACAQDSNGMCANDKYAAHIRFMLYAQTVGVGVRTEMVSA